MVWKLFKRKPKTPANIIDYVTISEAAVRGAEENIVTCPYCSSPIVLAKPLSKNRPVDKRGKKSILIEFAEYSKKLGW